MLKENRVQVHVPTLHPNTDELIIGNIKFKTFDLGGHETARRLWQDYFTTVDGVVYLVDAIDRGRFPEAKKELDALLTSEELQEVPFLVLGNKIDMPTAASEEELKYALGLVDTYGKDKGPDASGTRPIELYMCSVIRRMGYADGFKWLSQFLSQIVLESYFEVVFQAVTQYKTLFRFLGALEIRFKPDQKENIQEMKIAPLTFLN